MKHLIVIIVFLTSAISFSQTDAAIKGNLLDLEANNAPLELARITINETGTKTTSDKNGDFLFENLKPGTYNLTVSFVGYQTKTIKVKALPNRTIEIKESLSANTLSITDLMSAFASSEKTETLTTTASN